MRIEVLVCDNCKSKKMLKKHLQKVEQLIYAKVVERN